MYMTKSQMKALLKSQQGELDAVPMYQALAKAVPEKEDQETFLRLAKEEGRHASVFLNYTNVRLRPKKTKAILLQKLYQVLGRERLYPLIALGEYRAYKSYERLLGDFPEVESVRNDEKRHGDIVKGLLK